MSDLKPCPFCGTAPEVHSPGNSITYILCRGCGLIASFRGQYGWRETQEQWNQRADYGH